MDIEKIRKLNPKKNLSTKTISKSILIIKTPFWFNFKNFTSISTQMNNKTDRTLDFVIFKIYLNLEKTTSSVLFELF